MQTEVQMHVPIRFRRMVASWFDYQLSYQEKSALTQVFPKVVGLMQTHHPELSAEGGQPVGKAALCEALVKLFIETLGETEQLRARHDPDLPKHFMQPEMEEFLSRVAQACRATRHRAPFK